MNKRQVLDDVLAGRATAGTPSLFWKHFRPEEALGEAAVAAHRDWVAETEPVLVKVMNEQLYPASGPFASGSEWSAIGPYPTDDPRFQQQLALVREVVALYGQTHQVFVTMHGVVASAFHANGVKPYEEKRTVMSSALRDDPEVVDRAYQVVADSLVEHARAYLAAGADGIVYAALGGERNNYTREEFDTHVRPRDLQVLEAIGAAGGKRLLHICKDDLDLDRYDGYPAEMVGWGARLNDISLAEGRTRFPSATLVGGIDNTDPYFATESPDRERAAELVRQAIADAGSARRLIVSSDCSLPDPTPSSPVAAVSAAALAQATQEGN